MGHLVTEERFRPDHMVTYPLPLRGNVVLVRLDLPADLTAAEADKVCRFVRSIAVPDEDGP
jgi:hypothetical protein